MKKKTFEMVLIGGRKRMHVKDMNLKLSKQGSMYFLCDSNNKSPVLINTEVFNN
jgi:hypothetical protein